MWTTKPQKAGTANFDGGSSAAVRRSERLPLYVKCTNIKQPLESLVMATATRSARLGLRATPQQEAILRQAAEVANKSMTEFILDSAYRAAEQTLLDQRLFLVTGSQSQALLSLLDRPVRDNPGLKDLFSRRAPWAE